MMTTVQDTCNLDISETIQDRISKSLIADQPRVLIMPDDDSICNIINDGDEAIIKVNANAQKNPNIKQNRAYYLYSDKYLYHIQHILYGDKIIRLKLGNRFQITQLSDDAKNSIRKTKQKFCYMSILDFGFKQVMPSLLDAFELI